MDAVRLSVEIKEDRRLVIDLPTDLPVGRVEVVIVTQSQINEPHTTVREQLRAQLLSGQGLTTYHAPDHAVNLTNDELEVLGQLTTGAAPSEVLIDEERGDY